MPQQLVIAFFSAPGTTRHVAETIEAGFRSSGVIPATQIFLPQSTTTAGSRFAIP